MILYFETLWILTFNFGDTGRGPKDSIWKDLFPYIGIIRWKHLLSCFMFVIRISLFFLITNTLRCVLELLSSYSNSSTYSQKPSQPNFYIAYFFSIMIFSYTKGRTARPTLNSLAIYLLQGPFALAQVITECCSFALTFLFFIFLIIIYILGKFAF